MPTGSLPPSGSSAKPQGRQTAGRPARFRLTVIRSPAWNSNHRNQNIVQAQALLNAHRKSQGALKSANDRAHPCTLPADRKSFRQADTLGWAPRGTAARHIAAALPPSRAAPACAPVWGSEQGGVVRLRFMIRLIHKDLLPHSHQAKHNNHLLCPLVVSIIVASGKSVCAHQNAACHLHRCDEASASVTTTTRASVRGTATCKAPDQL